MRRLQNWLWVFAAVILSVNSLDDENEVGSGDSRMPQWNYKPEYDWKDRSPNTGWHDKHNSNKKNTGDNFDDEDQDDFSFGTGRDHRYGGEDDFGSGVDMDTKQTKPVDGVNNPDSQYPPSKEEKDNTGGGGIIIDENSPVDTIPCDQGYCLNGGTCFVFREQISQFYCYCPYGFTGKNCDVLQTENEKIGAKQGDDSPPRKETFTFKKLLKHPIFIAVAAFACLLFVALVITLLVCCCRCLRKKDEGSYALDSAMLGGQKVEYTKVENYSQEFYA